MQDRSSRRPCDPDQLAKLIVVNSAVGTTSGGGDQLQTKNPAAVAAGRLCGNKRGKTRAAKLSPTERYDIAARAVAVRWTHDC